MRNLVIAFILFSFTGLHAQTYSNGLHIELIGPEQGLPNRNIKCIQQDSIGFIWLGTTTGLVRYDGYHFKDFTYLLDKKDNSTVAVNDIKPDAKGNLWIAYSNGVSVIDPHTLSSKQVLLQNKFPALKTVFAARILFDRKGYTWISFMNGAFIKVDHNLEPIVSYTSNYNGPNPLGKGFFGTVLYSDLRGNICLYTNQNYIDIINDSGVFKRRIVLPDYKYNNLDFIPEYIRPLTNDTIKVQYTNYTANQTIFINCLLKNSSETYTFSATSVLASPDSIFKDKAGIEWISNGFDLAYRDPHSGQLNNITELVKESVGDKVSFLFPFVSRDNTLWMSSGAALLKIDLRTSVFQRYLNLPTTKENSVGTSMRGMLEDAKGNIWVCSYGYNYGGKTYTLHTLHPETETISNHELLTPGKGINNSYLLYKITMAGDYIYAVNDGNALLKIDMKDMQLKEVRSFNDIPGHEFVTLAVINDSILWMGTLGGMIQYNTRSNNTIHFNSLKDDGYIKNTRVNCFTKYTNDTWLACTGNGIYQLDSTAKILAYYGNEKNAAIQLPSTLIYYTCVYKNKLWAGSGAGLLYIDISAKKVKIYTTENGLPDSTIYTVLPDDMGNLWLSTNNGLCRFNVAKETVRNFGLMDGLTNTEFNNASYLKASNGVLYFGGLNGFVSVDPHDVDTSDQQQATLQPVSLSWYTAGKNTLNTLNANEISSTVTMNPGDRLFSFSFMTPDYRNIAQNRFRYKLEGWNDDEWHLFETGNKLTFNNLPPGTYKLHVQVSAAGGNWSSNDWTTTIHVNTPWYNTLWFYALSLLTVGGIVYSIYSYRLQQVMRIQNIRNRISADMHDEIGSTLSSISLYSQVLLLQSNDEKQKWILQRIKENALRVQEGLSDIVWSVKAGTDNMENIFGRMYSFGTELLDSKKIIFHFDVDEKLNHTKFDMGNRKNFYLIFKEALNNAVKYAACDTVWVKIEAAKPHIKMTIKDNGKGFDSANAKGGNGLSNMRERAKQMKGRLLIDSTIGEGSLVILVF